MAWYRVTDGNGYSTELEADSAALAIIQHRTELNYAPADKPHILVEECVEDEMEEFCNRMRFKWLLRESKNYVPPEKDTLEEIQDELLDIANYAMRQFFELEDLRLRIKDSSRAIQ